MAKSLASITIRKDLREKEGHGWVFEPEEKESGKVQILGMIEESMDAADYSIVGSEDLVRIEKKKGFVELFGNLINKENKERFERELEKLNKVKFKYLVVESSLNEDMMCLSVPQYRFGGPPLSKLTSMLFDYQLEFGIIPVFAGPCGKKIASQIFKNIARKYL